MNRQTFVRTLLPRCVALVLLGVMGGCSLLGGAAIGGVGAAANIASFSFSTGTEVYKLGKLESVELATYGKTDAAVRASLNDMRLRLESIRVGKNTADYEVTDDAGWTVSINLERHTALIVRVRIDVGVFGSEAFARVLLKAIRAHLPRAATQPTTAPATPVPLGDATYDASAPEHVLGPPEP